MASFDDSITSIQDLLGNHASANDTVVGRLYNSRHRNLLESHEWSRKKGEIIIALVAEESTGTFSVINGSSSVTGTSTSLSSADVGKYIRFSSDSGLYVVKAEADPVLTLGDFNGTTIEYQGTTDTTATYVLWKRWYSLGSGIESIISVFHQAKIHERDLEFLDVLDPTRQSTGDTPLYFARGPRDQSGTNDLVQIEFWPRASSAIAVTVGIVKGHTDLSGTSNPIVPSGIVEWGAAVDGCYFLFSKTKENKWLQLAGTYNGELAKTKEDEIALDNKKFGLSQAVKDVGGGVGLAHTDFGITHDTTFGH